MRSRQTQAITTLFVLLCATAVTDCGQKQAKEEPITITLPPSAAHAARITSSVALPSDCSRDVSADLNGIIAAAPDGSLVRFPHAGCYRLSDTLFVKDHSDMVIDGNGSTFTITSQGDTKPRPTIGAKTGGNWMLLRGKNITLKNMTAVGSFPLADQRRSLPLEILQRGYAEYMSNYGVYGTDGAYLEDLAGRAAWGDTVTTGPDTYVDNLSRTPHYARNVFVRRVRAEKASRMCFALTSGYNLWLEDSSCTTAWYGGSDEEVDSRDQPLAGVHILRNTWQDFSLFAIALPVAGPDVRDIDIRGNVVSTTPGNNKCGASIYVGGYPASSDSFANVTVDDNSFVSYGGPVVQFDHVHGGSVQNSRVELLSGGGCPAGPAAKVDNSTGVVVANNATVSAPAPPGGAAPPTIGNP